MSLALIAAPGYRALFNAPAVELHISRKDLFLSGLGFGLHIERDSRAVGEPLLWFRRKPRTLIGRVGGLSVVADRARR